MTGLGFAANCLGITQSRSNGPIVCMLPRGYRKIVWGGTGQCNPLWLGNILTGPFGFTGSNNDAPCVAPLPAALEPLVQPPLAAQDRR
jgi:hypothetical protein